MYMYLLNVYLFIFSQSLSMPILLIVFKGKSHHLIVAHLKTLTSVTNHLPLHDNRGKPAQMKVTCHIASPFPLTVPSCFFVKVSFPGCIISQTYFLAQHPNPSCFQLFFCSAANADPLTNTLELSFFYMQEVGKK